MYLILITSFWPLPWGYRKKESDVQKKENMLRAVGSAWNASIYFLLLFCSGMTLFLSMFPKYHSPTLPLSLDPDSLLFILLYGLSH